MSSNIIISIKIRFTWLIKKFVVCERVKLIQIHSILNPNVDIAQCDKKNRSMCPCMDIQLVNKIEKVMYFIKDLL